jgi:hypothetical protein
VVSCRYCGREMAEITTWPTVYKCPEHGLLVLTDVKDFEDAKSLFIRGNGETRFRQKAGQVLSRIGYAGPGGRRGFSRDQIRIIFSEWEAEMGSKPVSKGGLLGPSGAPLAEPPPEMQPEPEPAPAEEKPAWPPRRTEYEKKTTTYSSSEKGTLIVEAYRRMGTSKKLLGIPGYEITIEIEGGFPAYRETRSASEPIQLNPGTYHFHATYKSEIHGNFYSDTQEVKIEAGKVTTQRVIFPISIPKGGGGRGGKTADYSGITGAIQKVEESIKGLAGRGGERGEPQPAKVEVKTGAENPCPNCYHIHGEKWNLNDVPLNQIPEPVYRRLEYYTDRGMTIDEVYYCDSCRNYFFRYQHRLVPVVNDHCEMCGAERIYEKFKTPGAHAGTVYRLLCPKHGKGQWGCELAEQDFQEYLDFVKRVKTTRVNKRQMKRVDKLKSDFDVLGFGPQGEWRDSKGEMHEDIRAALGTGKNRQKFADEARKIDKEHEAERRMLKKYGVRHDDIGRLPPEEQDEARAYWEQLNGEGGDIDREYEKESAEKSKKFYEDSHRKFLGLSSKTMEDISRRTGPTVANAAFSLAIVAIGIFISAVIGSTWLIAACIALGIYIFTPNPEQNKLRHMPPLAGLGMFGMMFNQDNGINSGIATIKALSKLTALFCFGMTLFESKIPLSSLILLGFCLYISAGGLKISYDPRKPDEIMESMMRLMFVIIISIFVFGAFGGGIFNAPAVGMLYLAFFAILPKPSETNDLARTLGRGLAGVGANYELGDKILFWFIMIVSAGLSFTSIFSGGLDIGFFSGGTLGILFSAIWLISLIVGSFSPSEARPAIGVIVLIIAFITFGSTVGEQAMGTAFFGQWWPMIHNGATQILEPLGKLSETFGQTFGQSFLMLTNPVGYAQQIMNGQYANNPTGPTGAYGLEIENFAVDTIYLAEPFSIRFDLANRGPYTANNINLMILSNAPDAEIKDPAFQGGVQTLPYSGKTKYDHIEWYIYKYDSFTGHSLLGQREIIPQDIKPMFLTGTIGCTTLYKTPWGQEMLKKKPQEELRQHYISYMVNYTYEYSVDSNLQIDFISEGEWYNLVRDNKLVRTNVQSLVSTAPVKLSLGTMDQPIREGLPFFIGFNLTSSEGSNTKIGWADIILRIPSDLGMPDSCTKKVVRGTNRANSQLTKEDFDTIRASQNKGMFFIVPSEGQNMIAFALDGTDSKDVFCSWIAAPKTENRPKRTVTISANATYEFNKWEKKDTMINFRDVCGSMVVTNPILMEGTVGYCNYRMNVPQGQGKCNLGMGGCENDNQCCTSFGDCSGANNEGFQLAYDSKPLVCFKSMINGVGVCCPEGAALTKCQAAHNEWLRQLHSTSENVNGASIYQAFANG